MFGPGQAHPDTAGRNKGCEPIGHRCCTCAGFACRSGRTNSCRGGAALLLSAPALARYNYFAACARGPYAATSPHSRFLEWGRGRINESPHLTDFEHCGMRKPHKSHKFTLLIPLRSAKSGMRAKFPFSPFNIRSTLMNLFLEIAPKSENQLKVESKRSKLFPHLEVS